MGEPLRWIFVVLLAAFFSHCMTAPKRIVATDYRNQKVYMGKHRSYSVGALPKHWELKRDRGGVHFYDPQSGASIITDAFCEAREYETDPSVLLKQRLDGLSELKIQHEEKKENGVRVRAETRWEKQPVFLDLAVFQRRGCQFEFVAIIPEKDSAEVHRNFEQFFGGFSF